MVPEIGSTNAELVAGPRPRTRPEGTVLVAEHQVAGRGRLDRVWTSPPRAGLTVSFLLRPDVPAARRGWLPLLTGVALAEAVGEVTGVLPSLKWPNDLLALDGRKLAGILAETHAAPRGRRRRRAQRLHHGRGTARHRDVAVPGPRRDRSTAAPVLLAFLRAVERRYRRWTEALGDPVSSGLAQDYLAWSSTVGTDVAVSLPDGSTLEGTAQAVDWDGRLVVATAAGTVELASGDVRHVRRV